MDGAFTYLFIVIWCEVNSSKSMIRLFSITDSNPALGHPIEFICLDLDEPAICKYCGLRYIQEHHH